MKKKDAYLETVNGKSVFPWNLKREDVLIDDIANSLAMQARYNGHLPEFYSIADHSIHVTVLADMLMSEKDITPEERRVIRLRALLHDAAEAFISDIPSPVKMFIPSMYEHEDKMIKKIYSFYGAKITDRKLKKYSDQIIKKSDIMVLIGEKLDITNSVTRWPQEDIFKRCPFAIEYTEHWKNSKERFLDYFNVLTGGDYRGK